MGVLPENLSSKSIELSRISPSQQHPLLLPEEEGKNRPVEHQTGQEPTPGKLIHMRFIAGGKIKTRILQNTETVPLGSLAKHGSDLLHKQLNQASQQYKFW